MPTFVRMLTAAEKHNQSTVFIGMQIIFIPDVSRSRNEMQVPGHGRILFSVYTMSH